MKLSRHHLYAIVWYVAVAFTGYVCHNYFSISLSDMSIVLASATAVTLFGIVLFDFKAFSRAAAEASNMVLGRLGHRTFGTAGLCRPHGL